MDVFEAFETIPYTFLLLNRGGITGNTIRVQYPATGVFKLRSQKIQTDNTETKDSNATLHIRPTEEFLSATENNLVGHGVRIEGRDYEIIGQTGGMNFHTGVMEHYTATLQEADYSDFGGSGES